MKKIRMASWNINGFRAISKKQEWQWFESTNIDIVGFQETKASPEQIDPALLNPEGWNSVWSSSIVKKGYSGVAVYSKLEPLAIVRELPDLAMQGEGRLIHLEYPEFHYFNVYFPNGGAEIRDENGKATGEFKRVPYKMSFFDAFFTYAQELRKQKPIVVCGDFNIAHKEIDLARPKQNMKVTGFLPIERTWLDNFVQNGYVDTFRHVHGDIEGQYSWWSYKASGRVRNVGWRIDYFFASDELIPHIKNAWIEKDVFGSDHCPVGLELVF